MASSVKLVLLLISIVGSPSYAQNDIGLFSSSGQNILRNSAALFGAAAKPTVKTLALHVNPGFMSTLPLHLHEVNKCECSVTSVNKCKAKISHCLATSDYSCLFKAILECFPSQILTPEIRRTIYLIIIYHFSTPNSPLPLPPVPTTTQKPTTTTTTTDIFIPGNFTIRFDTGNNFLDLLISMLETLHERKIGYMIRDFIGTQKVTINTWEMLRYMDNIPEVLIVEEQIMFLISEYSTYRYNQKNLFLQLTHLRQTNAIKYLWLTKIIELIFRELKITTIEPTVKITRCDLPRLDVVNDRVCEQYCTESYGGKWIMVQSRREIHETAGLFEQGFEAYKKGFGLVNNSGRI